MPPAATALVVAGPVPWSHPDVVASREYKILMQFSSPKDINVTVSKSMWPDVSNLPDLVVGKVMQWQNKQQILLKIQWREADGEWKFDTDLLHVLLAHGLKLVTGPRGEALHLRGAQRAEAEAATPKRTIDVPYTDGGLSKVQTWTVEPNPEAITVNAREAPRFRATINRRTEDIDTPFKMWKNAMMPPKIIDEMVSAFNLRLSGKNRESRKTTKGEVIRFICYMPALALHPGTPLRKAWKQIHQARDISPPLAMGRHGMGKNRFELLLGLAGKIYPLNQKDIDTDNPWRFSEMPVNAFNEHVPTVIEPGYNIGPDESGSAWRGKEGTAPEECPHVSVIERKPEPICCELVDFACADSQCILGMEINKGKAGMANAKYTSEYGATTATNMRLSERYHHTQRTWGGDSWFTGLTELENGLSKGMWGYGDVKTHTSRTPIKELIEAVGPNSGDWAVFTTVVAGPATYRLRHRPSSWRYCAYLPVDAWADAQRASAVAQGRYRVAGLHGQAAPVPHDPQRLDGDAAHHRQAEPLAAARARHGEVLRHAELFVPPLHDRHRHDVWQQLRGLQPLRQANVRSSHDLPRVCGRARFRRHAQRRGRALRAGRLPCYARLRYARGHYSRSRLPPPLPDTRSRPAQHHPSTAGARLCWLQATTL